MTVGLAPWAIALLAVAGFAVALWRARVFSVVGGLAGEVTSGLAAMFDPALDDLAKERAVQQAGFSLLRRAWAILWRFAVAIGAAAVPIYAAGLLGLASVEASMGVLLRLDFIVVVSVAACLVAWLLTRGRARESGAGDETLHNLAFASPAVQRGLARLESRLFARRIAAAEMGAPIFVTSLARGGTTALLNALATVPGTASLRYRDMPFVTAPLLWNALSGRRQVARAERAHGDGMEIDLDSAEAFDEVHWMLGWPEAYRGETIPLWTEADLERTAALDAAFRSVTALRAPGGRYLSKNNANIARLSVLTGMFPGAQIVIPLRGPAAHAASLLRQHSRFIERHETDTFGRKYMADIGHFEFGALHKRLDFTGDFEGLTPDMPDYWLAYWIAAFRHVAGHSGDAILIDQNRLRAAPNETMQALLARLDLHADRDFSPFFRATPDDAPTHLFSDALLAEAEALYARLAAHSL
ncbi:MAG: sulfotransferase [Pseudomonadota bacterium]